MKKPEYPRVGVLAAAVGLLLALVLAACAGPAEQADVEGPASQGAQQIVAALTEDNGRDGNPETLTINVALDDSGFQPATVFIPMGRQVKLIVRNRGRLEHHFHIMGLPTEELLWLVTDHENPDPAITGEEHEEHMHGPGGTFVPYHICTSASGICPSGEWVHAHANPGGMDVIVFTPGSTGTFDIVCPLHPEMHGSAVVF